MEPRHRLLEKLVGAAQAVAAPTNYYHGRRRWPRELPDNVLIFMREAVQHLSPRRDADFHHRWVLLLAVAGCGTVRIDRQPCELRPGQAVLIPPLHLHDYVRVEERTLLWLFVTFEWPGHTAHSTRWRGVRSLNTLANEALELLVDTWVMRPTGEGTLLAAQVMNLLTVLFTDMGRQAALRRDEQKASRGILADVQGLMKLTPSPNRVGTLARQLGMSESHLRAKFRHETGISLGRYLRESRLREAAILLRSEDLSVKTTAERMGFNDIFAFSRAFKHVVGVPPSVLKKTATNSS